MPRHRHCVGTRTPGGVFVNSKGKRLPPKETLRMHSIRIPASFRDVCLLGPSDLPLMALATDGAGQQQYFYSRSHHKRSRTNKAKRVAKLARVIKKQRAKFRKLMNTRVSNASTRSERQQASKKRAVGLAFVMMDMLAMRPGKPQYVKNNRTYGATTLVADKHIEIKGNTVQFRFPGKKGVMQNVKLENDAEFVRALRAAIKEGTYFTGGYSVDVWHPKVMMEDLQIKDLRTLSANRMLLELAIEDANKNWHVKNWQDRDMIRPGRRVAQLIGKVARRIGHSYKVCRRNYIVWEVKNYAERILVGEKVKGDINDLIARLLT